MKKIFIVIPAFNEEEKISGVVEKILDFGYKNIIVIDDGSKDGTKKKLEKLQNQGKIIYSSHFVNKGAGAATQTGFDLALKKGAEICVTIDADGQHNPEEISKLIKPIENGECDLVIGSRFLKLQKMPIHRIFFNKIGNLITWFFFGLYVSDSQSGFKAFSKKALEKIQIENNGYEFCSEIIQKIYSNKIKFKEVQISVLYTKYSQSKGQSLLNGFKTLLKLFLHSLIR